jgi:hypothetical protein
VGTVGTARNVAPVDLPSWAQGGTDKRAALPWDTSQTIANCTINGNAALAIIDSGSYKTIMDVGMARMLGLPIRDAIGGDCGTYSVPGTGRSNTYQGIVDAEVRLQLAPGVIYAIQGLKLIDHPHPLILIGSDILSGGRISGQCNYTGLRLGTDGDGLVTGHICFDKGGHLIEERLVNVPTARGSHSAGTKTVGLISGPPVGGQCLRRFA